MQKTTRDRFLSEFPKAIADDGAAIFVGAGVSIGAGYPSWKSLLRDIGDELGVKSDDVADLAALAQWSITKAVGKTRVLKVIREEIAKEYSVPDSLRTISRLPIRNIWTTNYDRLIERAYQEIGRPVDAVSASNDLSVPQRPGAVRLFKMHGTIDQLNDIVISTDDYELYRTRRGAFLPLLQAHMMSFSILFLGLSFADPNLRHVLSLIRECFLGNPPEHFAIVRPPHENDFKTKKEYQSRLLQHKYWAEDLKRYGLHVIEIDTYDEVPILLNELERRVALGRVWVSGSWPKKNPFNTLSPTYPLDVAHELGSELGERGFSLVSGLGEEVGSACTAGFLAAFQKAGRWDLERRLFVRPFPQPVEGNEPEYEQWDALRTEMARISGVVVFVGGLKFDDKGYLVDADGVFSEFEKAKEASAFLLPIGATGGSATKVAEQLIGSDIRSSGANALRPTDSELKALMKFDEPPEIAKRVFKILKRVGMLRD